MNRDDRSFLFVAADALMCSIVRQIDREMMAQHDAAMVDSLIKEVEKADRDEGTK